MWTRTVPVGTIGVVPAQDDVRENQMVDLFNLMVPPNRGRSDIDAYLDLEGHPEPIPFELKSTTTGSVSTVRDFGPEHIQRWADLHWLFAFYERDGTKPLFCSYASPADMADWIERKQRYVRPDYVLAERAPQVITDDDLTKVVGSGTEFDKSDAFSIMKKQWSAEKYRDRADLPGRRYSRKVMLEILQERCGYVIRRGATLNNPHIEKSYFAAHDFEKITKEHAARLRELVQKYFADLKKGTTSAAAVDPVIASQASKAAATEDASE